MKADEKIDPVGPFQGLNGKWGYIDRDKGGWVVEPKFDMVYEFSDCFYDGDLAAVELDGKIGFINIKGELIWEPQFEIAKITEITVLDFIIVNRFYGDIGFVKKNNRFGFIKNDGTWIVQPEYTSISFLSPGRKRMAYINDSIIEGSKKSGEVILKDKKLILEVKKGVLRRPLKQNLL